MYRFESKQAVKQNTAGEVPTRLGEQGFTLLEVVITMAIFAVGILGLQALYIMGIQSNSMIRKMNITNNIALDLMENVQTAPYLLYANGVPEDGTGNPVVPCVLPPPDNNIADCLKPDQDVSGVVDPTIPPPPYDVLVSDAPGVYIQEGPIQFRREITIVREDSGIYGNNIRKTIQIKVFWRDPSKPNDIHEIEYFTIRDRDVSG